jgi:CheY-like chemotaxis protein
MAVWRLSGSQFVDIRGIILSIDLSAEQIQDHLTDFQGLIKHRVDELLLVASIYDSFLLAGDGQLQDLISNEFANTNLYHAPKITRVSKASKALKMVREDNPYKLILLTMNLGDMQIFPFVRELRDLGITVPIILLTYDNRELKLMVDTNTEELLDYIFVWQGDFRILMAMVKLVEDQQNIDRDASLIGVQAIILVEDSVRFYSSYLPIIYTEIMRQSQLLLGEGLNLAHRMIRLRGRPKILLCRTYEEACITFDKHQNNLMGIITDLEFPREGKIDKQAGIRFIKKIRQQLPELPVLLQSNQSQVNDLADELDVSSLKKSSSKLLHELRHFMRHNFGFGDFVFRMPNGDIVARAKDLHSLEKLLEHIPDESLALHALNGHFSRWLKSRTEFSLAAGIAKSKWNDHPDAASVREFLICKLRAYRLDRMRGIVSEFNPDTFDSTNSLAQVGNGSMGGKARGLSFVRHLINLSQLRFKFAGIKISIPPAVILCTEVFDQFMELNDLEEFVLDCENDQQIRERFCSAKFPPLFKIDLQKIVELMDYPLAVRSSSLLEDSQYQPFAGIYRTIMLPNDDPDLGKRLSELVRAVKLVYASTYCKAAKGYIRSTPYRMEEEKMAVVIQRLQGTAAGGYFYPTLSGAARSYDYYPTHPAQSADGVASVALGLGHLVMDGSQIVRFCPKYPNRAQSFSNADDVLRYSQRQFCALQLKSIKANTENIEGSELEFLDLELAEKHGNLDNLASVFSLNDNRIYDGLSHTGPRIISFAPILKYDQFPLAAIIQDLLEIGEKGMSRNVEVEFAASLTPAEGELKEFSVLQMRPMVTNRELENIKLDIKEPADILCRCDSVLGSGRLEDLKDIIVVDIDKFQRGCSLQVAEEVGKLNQLLIDEDRNSILIGVGRWGSSDPWLGIPITWDQINSAAVIVEAGFHDMQITPSQGSHFFQNLTSLGIGYFSINPELGEGLLDWQWMRKQNALVEYEFTRLIRFKDSLQVLMNGRERAGIILKPGISLRSDTSSRGSSNS